MDLLEQEMSPLERGSRFRLWSRGSYSATSWRRDAPCGRRSRSSSASWPTAFVTAYPMGGLPHGVKDPRRDPRVLDLGELERVRDELAERLRSARVTIAERADIQEANRLCLERMLLEPAKHRFARISREDVGEPGCGVWHVRPRLGLIGMLMGWWQVKLSSGCPLPRAATRACGRHDNVEAR